MPIDTQNTSIHNRMIFFVLIWMVLVWGTNLRYWSQSVDREKLQSPSRKLKSAELTLTEEHVRLTKNVSTEWCYFSAAFRFLLDTADVKAFYEESCHNGDIDNVTINPTDLDRCSDRFTEQWTLWCRFLYPLKNRTPYERPWESRVSGLSLSWTYRTHH